MTDKDYLEKITSELSMFCNTCFKTINKNEPHIVAYKNGCPAYFCRDHIHDVECYLDCFQELVDIRR